MAILGFGVIIFLFLSLGTFAFAGVLAVIGCDCIAAAPVFKTAVMFGLASNICLFIGFYVAVSDQAKARVG